MISFLSLLETSRMIGMLELQMQISIVILTHKSNTSIVQLPSLVPIKHEPMEENITL